MTMLPDQEIRRRDDGSIDIQFYGRRANALRRAAIEDFGRRRFQTLQVAARAWRGLAAPALPRA
jgi:hypothetical protein